MSTGDTQLEAWSEQARRVMELNQRLAAVLAVDSWPEHGRPAEFERTPQLAEAAHDLVGAVNKLAAVSAAVMPDVLPITIEEDDLWPDWLPIAGQLDAAQCEIHQWCDQLAAMREKAKEELNRVELGLKKARTARSALRMLWTALAELGKAPAIPEGQEEHEAPF